MPLLATADDMLAFAAIVKAGSIAAAARNLALPPSTLSRRLMRLERRLGVRLLERSTRSLALTEAGEAYYHRCARIAEEVAEADALVQSHGRTPKGVLRLSAPPLLGALVLCEPLARYATKYPAVRLDVRLSERLVDLRKEPIDVAVRSGPLPRDGAYIVRKLGESSRVLCASPAYLKRHGVPRSVAALREHALIALDTSGAGAAHAFWPQLELEPRTRVNNLPLAHELCRRGLGLALLPRFLVAADVRNGALAEVRVGEAPAAAQIFAAMPEASAATPKVRAFLDILTHFVARERPWE
jgi:DNA-binding transcriptional LysR family regulator